MGRKRPSWLDSLTKVARSLAAVVRSELALLGDEWKSSLSQAGKAVGLLLAAAATVLLTLPPLLAVALLHALTRWLPLWGAALVTAGVILLLAAVPALVGYSWLKRWQTPVQQTKLRLGEHLDWWQGQVMEGSATLTGGNMEGKGEEDASGQAKSTAE